MPDNTDRPSRNEAQAALGTVSALAEAGRNRAAPTRWFGAGVALLIASLFALYALDDPYPYIVLPIIGLAVFITAMREAGSAYGRDFVASKAYLLGFVALSAILVAVLIGSIAIRRTFDMAWVPIVAGLGVGLVLFLVNESARRALLARRRTGSTA
jgi:hypothetical protein